jgi:hypothetical protein
MLKKIIFVIPLLMLSVSIYSQSDINSYKYVIVPKSFKFSKEVDEFKLNTLAKYSFNKYGFISIFDDEPLPEELINNGCLALTADVIKDSGVFKTKLQIELLNCRKEVVFLSKVGESREKKLQVAYNLALREAFDSFKTVNYKFEPSETESVVTTATSKKETEKLPEEIKTLKSENQKNPVSTTPKVLASEVNINKASSPDTSNVFTAKLKNEGVFAYDLINSNGKIIYTILFSGKDDVYIVKDLNAIIYKMNNNWVIAKSKLDNSLEVKAIKISF